MLILCLISLHLLCFSKCQRYIYLKDALVFGWRLSENPVCYMECLVREIEIFEINLQKRGASGKDNMNVTLTAIGCGCCCKSNDSKKHGILSLICPLPHTMYCIWYFQILSPAPPPLLCLRESVKNV
jgi:hypothetical protein